MKTNLDNFLDFDKAVHKQARVPFGLAWSCVELEIDICINNVLAAKTLAMFLDRTFSLF